MLLAVGPAAPAHAVEWSGHLIPGTDNGGTCSTTYRGLENPDDGYQFEYACQAAIPDGSHMVGPTIMLWPIETDGGKWQAFSPSGFSPTACPLPNSVPGNPQLGTLYTGLVDGNGVCGSTAEGQHQNDYFVAIMTAYSAGPVVDGWRAVQYRLLVVFLDPAGSTNAMIANIMTDVAGAGAFPTGVCHGSCGDADERGLGMTLSNGTTVFHQNGGELLQESDQSSTPPQMPSDFFPGGSPGDLGPCVLVSWTGPPRDSTWQAGVEYAFRFEWTGEADEISVWSDGVVTHVDAPVSGSPQTVLWTAAETGQYNVHAACEANGEGYGWGAYTNADLNPNGDDTTQNCLQSSGIGLNPSSWVPAIGRMSVCLVKAFFLPTMLGDQIGELQEATEGSVLEAGIGVGLDVWGAPGEFMAAAGSGTCAGLEINVAPGPLGDDGVITPISACSGTAQDWAVFVKTALRLAMILGGGIFVVNMLMTIWGGPKINNESVDDNGQGRFVL